MYHLRFWGRQAKELVFGADENQRVRTPPRRTAHPQPRGEQANFRARAFLAHVVGGQGFASGPRFAPVGVRVRPVSMVSATRAAGVVEMSGLVGVGGAREAAADPRAMAAPLTTAGVVGGLFRRYIQPVEGKVRESGLAIQRALNEELLRGIDKIRRGETTFLNSIFAIVAGSVYVPYTVEINGKVYHLASDYETLRQEILSLDGDFTCSVLSGCYLGEGPSVLAGGELIPGAVVRDPETVYNTVFPLLRTEVEEDDHYPFYNLTPVIRELGRLVDGIFANSDAVLAGRIRVPLTSMDEADVMIDRVNLDGEEYSLRRKEDREGVKGLNSLHAKIAELKEEGRPYYIRAASATLRVYDSSGDYEELSEEGFPVKRLRRAPTDFVEIPFPFVSHWVAVRTSPMHLGLVALLAGDERRDREVLLPTDAPPVVSESGEVAVAPSRGRVASRLREPAHAWRPLELTFIYPSSRFVEGREITIFNPAAPREGERASLDPALPSGAGSSGEVAPAVAARGSSEVAAPSSRALSLPRVEIAERPIGLADPTGRLMHVLFRRTVFVLRPGGQADVFSERYVRRVSADGTLGEEVHAARAHHVADLVLGDESAAGTGAIESDRRGALEDAASEDGALATVGSQTVAVAGEEGRRNTYRLDEGVLQGLVALASEIRGRIEPLPVSISGTPVGLRLGDGRAIDFWPMPGREGAQMLERGDSSRALPMGRAGDAVTGDSGSVLGLPASHDGGAFDPASEAGAGLPVLQGAGLTVEQLLGLSPRPATALGGLMPRGQNRHVSFGGASSALVPSSRPGPRAPLRSSLKGGRAAQLAGASGAQLSGTVSRPTAFVPTAEHARPPIVASVVSPPRPDAAAAAMLAAPRRRHTRGTGSGPQVNRALFQDGGTSLSSRVTRGGVSRSGAGEFKRPGAAHERGSPYRDAAQARRRERAQAVSAARVAADQRRGTQAIEAITTGIERRTLAQGFNQWRANALAQPSLGGRVDLGGRMAPPLATGGSMPMHHHRPAAAMSAFAAPVSRQQVRKAAQFPSSTNVVWWDEVVDRMQNGGRGDGYDALAFALTILGVCTLGLALLAAWGIAQAQRAIQSWSVTNVTGSVTAYDPLAQETY